MCTTSQSSPLKIASCKLTHIETTLSDMNAAIATLNGDYDKCLLCQYEEEVSNFKKELFETHNELLKLKLDSDDLMVKLGLSKKPSSTAQ